MHRQQESEGNDPSKGRSASNTLIYPSKLVHVSGCTAGWSPGWGSWITSGLQCGVFDGCPILLFVIGIVGWCSMRLTGKAGQGSLCSWWSKHRPIQSKQPLWMERGYWDVLKLRQCIIQQIRDRGNLAVHLYARETRTIGSKVRGNLECSASGVDKVTWNPSANDLLSVTPYSVR